MQTGKAILDELKREMERLRQQLTQQRHDAHQLDVQLQDLVEQRGSTILELAQHYLPDLSRDRVLSTFHGIRDALQQIVARQERQVANLAGQRERLQLTITELERQLTSTTEQLSVQVANRERLSKLVADKLAADALFQDASRLAITAETELHKNEQRAQEIAADARDKLPAYERSSLFQYLQRAGYGTSDYSRRGLTRRWDRWLANLIGYARAIQGYQFLTEAPRLVAAEIERRRTEFHPLMATVEQIERATADELGLTQVLAIGDQLGKQRDELVARVGEQRSLLQTVDEKLLAIQQSEGPFYDEALTRFRQFLEQTETAALAQQAQTTPEAIDDQLVARLQTLVTEINALQPQRQQQQARQTQVESICSQLEFIVRRYQQANFDSPRSQFASGFEVDRELDRLQKHVIDKEAFWDNLRHAQQFEPTWLEESAQGMAGNAGQILANPLTQVLMHAMVEAAGAALQSAAQRSVQRRSLPSQDRRSQRIDVPTPKWTRTNSTPAPRPAAPRPSPAPSNKRGFTTGDGF